MKLKTYVINLEKSTVRRHYMESLLSNFDFLDVEFIKAVDGRLLTEKERQSLFDCDTSRSLYGKTLNAGEIGCALSHRKVYETFLESAAPFALVLEDDITILRDLHKLNLKRIDEVVNNPGAKALMLSGDYWYYRRKDIVRLYAAVGAYAYIVNRDAARKILSITPPCCVADDWLFYKRHGVKLFAVHPYMVDANMNMDLLGSDVKQDDWSNNRALMSLKENILSAFAGLMKRSFKLFHHFENKTRIIDNVIV